MMVTGALPHLFRVCYLIRKKYVSGVLSMTSLNHFIQSLMSARHHLPHQVRTGFQVHRVADLMFRTGFVELSQYPSWRSFHCSRGCGLSRSYPPSLGLPHGPREAKSLKANTHRRSRVLQEFPSVDPSAVFSFFFRCRRSRSTPLHEFLQVHIFREIHRGLPLPPPPFLSCARLGRCLDGRNLPLSYPTAQSALS